MRCGFRAPFLEGKFVWLVALLAVPLRSSWLLPLSGLSPSGLVVHEQGVVLCSRSFCKMVREEVANSACRLRVQIKGRPYQSICCVPCEVVIEQRKSKIILHTGTL